MSFISNSSFSEHSTFVDPLAFVERSYPYFSPRETIQIQKKEGKKDENAYTWNAVWTSPAALEESGNKMLSEDCQWKTLCLANPNRAASRSFPDRFRRVYICGQSSSPHLVDADRTEMAPSSNSTEGLRSGDLSNEKKKRQKDK